VLRLSRRTWLELVGHCLDGLPLEACGLFGGHPDGRVEVLETRAELLVGVHPGAPRTDHHTALPPGSTLLLHTDGLIEQRAGDRDIDAGTARVVQSLTGQADLPLEALVDRVLEVAHEPREDDIVVLAVRVHPLG